MDMKLFLEDAWKKHRGKTVGTALGIAIGVSIMLFGFFRTAFILLCGCIGLYVGKKVDEDADFKDIIEKIIPPGFRR